MSINLLLREGTEIKRTEICRAMSLGIKEEILK
jgi:hypothetical protein